VKGEGCEAEGQGPKVAKSSDILNKILCCEAPKVSTQNHKP